MRRAPPWLTSRGSRAVHRSNLSGPERGVTHDRGSVAHDLNTLIGRDGVVLTADLASRVDRHTVSRWVSSGRLLRPHPGVVALPERFDDWYTRALAGVLATRGALSHVSALAVWR